MLNYINKKTNLKKYNKFFAYVTNRYLNGIEIVYTLQFDILFHFINNVDGGLGGALMEKKCSKFDHKAQIQR